MSDTLTCSHCGWTGPSRMFIWRGGGKWFCARVSLCRFRRALHDKRDEGGRA